jgi:uncharacterized iron-regulated membrane protein
MTKAIWSAFGLAPAAMFATGAIMWWNRLVRTRWQDSSQREIQKETTVISVQKAKS